MDYIRLKCMSYPNLRIREQILDEALRSGADVLVREGREDVCPMTYLRRSA